MENSDSQDMNDDAVENPSWGIISPIGIIFFTFIFVYYIFGFQLSIYVKHIDKSNSYNYLLFSSMLIQDFITIALVYLIIIKFQRVAWKEIGLKDLKNIKNIKYGIKGYLLIIISLICIGIFFTGIAFLMDNLGYQELAEAIRKELEFADKYSKEILKLSLWQMLIAICLLAPIIEEILNRGILYPPLRRLLGVRAGMIATALFFSFFHLGQGIVGFVMRFVIGYILTWLYERRRNLAAPITAHIMQNTVTTLLAKFVVDVPT